MGQQGGKLPKPSAGFEGSLAGLSLSDVIEMCAQNRFSGGISVECDVSRGLLFFRDGEVVSAELDGEYGEEAFYEILAWPTGTFAVQPNVATTQQTIQRPWKFLLMEAHRRMDERRAGHPPSSLPPGDRPSPAPVPAAGAPQPTPLQRTLGLLRAVPGVTGAVVLTKAGAPVGDEGFEAEKLAGESAYLTHVTQRLGELLGAGTKVSALAQGADRHLLQLVSARYDLTLAVDGAARPAAVEAEIRKLLAPKT